MNACQKILLTVAFVAATQSLLVASDTAPMSLVDAFTQGRFSLNACARYESVNQIALRNAEALTLRTRLGFTTTPL